MSPDRTVLAVNAGSSSLKLSLLDSDDTELAATTVQRWGGAADVRGVREFIEALDVEVDLVAHRVVHGGEHYREAVLVDEAVERDLRALTPLAPLHQPRSIDGLVAVRSALPDVAHVVCFDTAFHATLPPSASTYALPKEWRERWGLRRYGFHGLSHSYASRRGAELVGRDAADLRIVTCHLGSGASLCAVDHGLSVDTTMGFTPTEGLVMGTRSGNVDPGMMTWLMAEGRLTPEQLADGIVHSSGLAGLSGTSGDARDVEAAAATGSADALLALDVWAHRLRSEIASMVAAMGGIDLLVVTGGLGEHAAAMREQGLRGLDHLGIRIDPVLNAALTGEGQISEPGSAVRTVVVTAREDVEMARQARLAVA